ncbi:hypothetical protein XV92_06140 [Vibrio metoecus]|uniref:Uncharacterized protein n=1 Tax=Vibrio metoecus TaxID=1481663 RepID=A0A0Q0V2U3_VIBMT|nr:MULTISPECIES: hypothetical protein [Vibrio]KQB03124.1 hypothetical protein XV92_06140 [Vibrio metoecus]KQB11172.1 hypothetical protein XV94_01540 [Vibrio metoecus]PAR20781.1 hypothetical protein CGU03_10645 [Vibrio metoecus]PAR25249.1 hypothetical protein CGU02_04435 [Vibrio metoecus]PAR37104.1 hypothetical protein CGT97_02515 [Vibrio metoecus]
MNGLPHQIALQRIFALHSSQPFIMDAGGSGCRKRPLILLDGVTQVTPIPCRNVLFFVELLGDIKLSKTNGIC